MFEQAFRNIDDVLRKEAGCTTELDYTEQTSWLLFLKYLDDLERANRAARSLHCRNGACPVSLGRGNPPSSQPNQRQSGLCIFSRDRQIMIPTEGATGMTVALFLLGGCRSRDSWKGTASAVPIQNQ